MLMSGFILYFDSHVFVFHYYCFSVFKKFQFKLQLRLLVFHHFNHFDFDFLKKIMVYILINKYIMTGFVWNILVFRQFYFYYNFLYTGSLGFLYTVSFFFLVIEELGYRNSGIRVRARGVRGIVINADEKSKKNHMNITSIFRISYTAHYTITTGNWKPEKLGHAGNNNDNNNYNILL